MELNEVVRIFVRLPSFAISRDSLYHPLQSCCIVGYEDIVDSNAIRENVPVTHHIDQATRLV